jgi:hypothetical protein
MKRSGERIAGRAVVAFATFVLALGAAGCYQEHEPRPQIDCSTNIGDDPELVEAQEFEGMREVVDDALSMVSDIASMPVEYDVVETADETSIKLFRSASNGEQVEYEVEIRGEVEAIAAINGRLAEGETLTSEFLAELRLETDPARPAVSFVFIRQQVGVQESVMSIEFPYEYGRSSRESILRSLIESGAACEPFVVFMGNSAERVNELINESYGSEEITDEVWMGQDVQSPVFPPTAEIARTTFEEFRNLFDSYRGLVETAG